MIILGDQSAELSEGETSNLECTQPTKFMSALCYASFRICKAISIKHNKENVELKETKASQKKIPVSLNINNPIFHHK